MGRWSDWHPRVAKQQACGKTGPVDTAKGLDSPSLPHWLSLGVQQYLMDPTCYAMPNMLNVALVRCTELFPDVDLNINKQFRDADTFKNRVWLM